MPRRRLLIASATTLPLLLATTGCRSADLFAGPDPLGGRPPLAPETVVVEAAIAAEVQMISRYKSVISGAAGNGKSRGVLAGLLAQHEQHLVQLRARLIVPAGASASESPSANGSPGPAAASSAGPETITGLRTAERQSAAALLRQLVTVEPALAQLLASIAASDATHVSALAAL
jgi:hypothetical protein